MGRKRMRPIIFSYDLPSSMMESHSMVLLINGEHACPICKQEIIKIIRQDWDRWSLSGQDLLLEKILVLIKWYNHLTCWPMHFPINCIFMIHWFFTHHGIQLFWHSLTLQ
jgi:hypothetical protein